MLSKCANPACPTPFHYLHDGRLYRMETGAHGPQLVGEKKTVRKIEYFWLCNGCSDEMTLSYQPGKGVITVPREQARRAAAFD